MDGFEQKEVEQIIDRVEVYFHRFYAWVAAVCICAAAAIWTPLALVATGKAGLAKPRRAVACFNRWVYLIVCLIVVYALYDVARLMWFLGRNWLATNAIIAGLVMLLLWPLWHIMKGVSNVDTVDYESWRAPCSVVTMGVWSLACLPVVVDLEQLATSSKDLLKMRISVDKVTPEQRQKLNTMQNQFESLLEDLPSIRRSTLIAAGSCIAVSVYLWGMWSFAPIPRPKVYPLADTANLTVAGRVARALCLG